ncbi:MAG: winged helix-turn-helix transcriptional regulator [Clostridia bacterium]|nr:winged helix-turn-helix transcriptional regulator [Clostridia bacterium]
MNKYSFERGIEMYDEELIYDLADLFKVFADSTRIRILHCLLDKESCVGDIATALEMSQTAISHQLRVLKQSHLVRCRRDGKQMYYSLADDHVKTILAAGLEHVEE